MKKTISGSVWKRQISLIAYCEKQTVRKAYVNEKRLAVFIN